MLKIYDGRDYFYQWDRGQRLIVDDPRVSEVNFCNGTLECTMDADIYEEDGLRLADVPDVLLQTDKAINVFTVIKAEGQAATTRTQKFHVQRRTKPDDYDDPIIPDNPGDPDSPSNPDDPVQPDQPKLQEKTITANGEYTPDEGYDGFSKVSVNVPTGGGQDPTDPSDPVDPDNPSNPDDPVQPDQTELQEKTFTANGAYTPDEGYDGFNKVIVNVPIPAGFVKPTGTRTVTTNGTYDISGYASVKVNVPETEDSPMPVEVESMAEMVALLDTAPIGAIYKYVGEADDVYEYGELYIVCD